MKIILSRKGFDSSYGGCPSPIFADDRLLSLPIPASHAPSRFSDLVFDEYQVGELVASLSRGKVDPESPAHLDPDLQANAMDRPCKWRPAFGQTGSAQSHLASNGIGAGDLFLFFGWFRRVTRSDNRWRYELGAPDLHVIFGWMYVAEVLNVGVNMSKFMQSHPWLQRHPHLHGQRSSSNTIYLAAETSSSVSGNISTGGGMFKKLRPELILTASGQGKRSLWALPDFFSPGDRPPLSYHKASSRWSKPDNGQVLLQSVAKGQEFILDTMHYPEVVDWAKMLIQGDNL